MRRDKILPYLALALCVAQVLVVLASWLLTAAMPESFSRSLTSAEGIRWFFGSFADNLASPCLVWLVLVSIALGALRASGLLHYDSSEYRQRTALRLVAIELVVALALMLALTLVPHAILLNVLGGLLPSSFSRSIIPYACLSVVVMSLSYGVMSERLKGIRAIYGAMNEGIRLMAPTFLFYVLAMQLYCSVKYLM